MISRDLRPPDPNAITKRARAAGIALSDEAAAILARHAEAVLEVNSRLHLTSITEPGEFLERHLGEALEGAALLPVDIVGNMVDLGSGNGYPGLPIAIARPGMEATLAERSAKKAAFLREAIRTSGSSARVLECSVERAADLACLGAIHLLVTRAMGGWERVVPRLRSALAPDATILLWAGSDAASVFADRKWDAFQVVTQRALPHRVRSSIYQLKLK